MKRRDFLASVSLFSIAAVSPAKLISQSASETKLVPQACRAGAFWAEVGDGAVLNTLPRQRDTQANSFLTDGQVGKLKAPTRILYPYVRESYLNATGGQTSPELRGKDRFVQVDWDTAIGLVADTIRNTIEKHGNQAIFSPSHGGTAHGGALTPNVLQAEFFHHLGGMSVQLDDYGGVAGKSMAPLVLGDREIFNRHSDWEVIHDNTECFVLVGLDPRKNGRFADGTASHRDDREWDVLRDGDVEIISLNPQRTLSDEELGAEWVPILPGTDTALFLAMTHHLVEQDLHDVSYLDSHTKGWRDFVAYLNGGMNGITRGPEWAADITGISADQIRELAETFARKRTQFAMSRASLRTEHGEMAFWAPIAFTCFTGQFGAAGGGVSCKWQWGISDTNKVFHSDTFSAACTATNIADMLLKPGSEYQHTGEIRTYPEIKVIYSCGSNLVNRQSNTQRFLEGLQNVETHIVQDCWWTATARYADIILPETTTLECDDISFEDSSDQGTVYAMRKAIEPLGESLDGYEIFSRLALALGIGDDFLAGQSRIDRLKSIYAASNAGKHTDWDEFWESGVAVYEPANASTNHVLYGAFYQDADANPLDTPSGKVELFSDVLAALELSDCPPVPSWVSPSEPSPQSLGDGYFALTTPFAEMRLASSYGQTELRHEQNISDREFVRIHSQDASDIGVANGDLVEVSNNRGSAVLGARVDDGIKRGVASINLGAWLSLDDNGRCNSGSVGMLTSDRPSSRFSQGSAATRCTVKITPIGSGTERNTAYEPPQLN